MSGEARAAAALFDPSRLRLAREAAGLTKAALAEAAGITAAAVSQFESGRNRPSPATVARLAWALDVSPSFLEARPRPVPMPSSEDAFFRSLRATTRLQRRQASARAATLAEVAAELETLVRLPPVALPPSAGFDDTTAPQAIIDHAAVTREALGIPHGPVRHLVRQLEARGVVIAPLAREDGRVSAFSQWFDGRPVVMLQSGDADMAKRRYDLAHELGHLVMHSDPDAGNAIAERQANAFAAAFLLPAAEIRDQLPTRYDLRRLVDLKRTWGVSIQALLYRARELGVLSADAYRRSMIRLSSTHGRRNEPHPLTATEQPVLLLRAAQLAFPDNPTTRLAERTGLPEAWVRHLLAAPRSSLALEPGDVLADLAAHRAERTG